MAPVAGAAVLLLALVATGAMVAVVELGPVRAVMVDLVAVALGQLDPALPAVRAVHSLAEVAL